jgi:hypothetical protein
MVVQRGNRGVSPVLGSILIFGVVVLLLSVLQVYAVPAEDKSVELTHYQGVQEDLQAVRSALLDVGGPGTVRMASTPVDLGLRYPTRMVLLSPPPASGRLGTERVGTGEITAGTVDVARVCGTDGPARTKTLTYDPGYARFDMAPIRLEQGLLYRQEADGTVLRESGQPLVDGTDVHVYALQGDVAADGVGAADLDLHGAGVVGVDTTVPGPVDLVVPTRLSASDWREALAGESTVETVSSARGGDAVEITFDDTKEYTLRCSVVGIGTTPDVDPETTVADVNDRESNQINPNYDGSVILVDAAESGGDAAIEFKNNDDESRTIEEARFPFYAPDGQGGSGGDLPETLTVRSAALDRSGRFEAIDPVDFDPGETRTLTMSFECSGGTDYTVGSGDFFVFSVIFENGESQTYFIAPQSGKTGGCNGGGGGSTGGGSGNNGNGNNN